MPYIDDAGTLSQQITSLELEIATVDAGDAGSSTPVLFINVVFTDGTRLYEPFTTQLDRSLSTSYLLRARQRRFRSRSQRTSSGLLARSPSCSFASLATTDGL